MTTWTNDELGRIGGAEELQIASRRGDGTLRRPVTIWVVGVDDALYVRSGHGRDSGWFRGVLTRHEGFVRAGGVAKDVSFVEEADAALHDQIDAAYRAKYRRQPVEFVNACLTPQARAATWL